MTVPHVGDWRLPSPACFAVIGQSSTGKSTLIAKLIEDASVWQKRPNNVVYSGPVVKRTSKYIEDLEANCARQGMRFIYHEDFASVKAVQSLVGEKVPVILILDDVQVWSKHYKVDEECSKLLTAASHHDNITVFFVIHNPYHPSFGDVNNNVRGRFLMYQNSDWNKYQIMSNRMYGRGGGDFLKYCLTRAMEEFNLNYVYINVDPRAKYPTRWNCYTGILKMEREKHCNSPIVFDLFNYEKK
jgi:hypothetical protein